MTATVYLVSGATRGIGLAMVAQLVERENTIVFAGARDPASAKNLRALQEQHPGKLHIVRLISADRAGNEAAVAKVKEVAGRLDVVIANAGMNASFTDPLETTIEAMREHFEVNAIGPLVLFQSAYELLKASSKTPKFIVVTTGLGSVKMGTAMPFPSTPYAASKAALNWLAARIWHAYPDIVTVPVSPGLVDTGMAAGAVAALPAVKNLKMLTPEASAKAVLKLVDEAERGDEPKLLAHDGKVHPW